MLPHDLLEAEEARAVLNMPAAKFELLVSSGQLPIFRSSGRTCFRREDISAIALKRQAVQAKLIKPVEKTRTAKPAENEKDAQKERDKYAVTRQTLPSLKAKTTAQPPSPKPRIESAELQDDDEDARPSAKPQARPNKRTWLMVGCVVVAILTAAWTFIGARQKTAEPPIAQQPLNSGQFAHCKAAPGLVEAVTGERPLSFEVTGKLRTVNVEEGQRVKAGERIAELENTDLVAKLKSSQADLSAAEAKLGILQGNLESELKKAESEMARLNAELVLLDPRQENVDEARADTKAVEANARRMSDDEKKYSNPSGLGTSWSIQQYDNAKGLSEAAASKLESSRAHLRALESGSRPEEKARMRAMLAGAEAEVVRQKATGPFQLQSARAQVDQAKAQVDLAKAELDKTRLTSPIDGMVVRKFMHPGEIIDVLHPQPVVTVADMSRLRVRADVDEADFPGIAPGQRVKIGADAFGDGKYFNGTVEEISHATGPKPFSTGEAKERMDVKIVETLVTFDAQPPPRMMKLGLRVRAYFEITK